MENNGKQRIKLRLNIFDIVIIGVAIVALILVIIWKMPKNTLAPSGGKTINYTIEITMLKDASEHIGEGDAIIEAKKNYELGNVVSVEVKPDVRIALDYEQGKATSSVNPLSEKALIEISATVSETEKSVRTQSEFELLVGKQIDVKGPGYAGSGYIVSIERGDQ